MTCSDRFFSLAVTAAIRAVSFGHRSATGSPYFSACTRCRTFQGATVITVLTLCPLFPHGPPAQRLHRLPPRHPPERRRPERVVGRAHPGRPVTQVVEAGRRHVVGGGQAAVGA